MKKFYFLLILIFSLININCGGPTRLEVVKLYQPKFAPLQKKLEEAIVKIKSIKEDFVSKDKFELSFNEKQIGGNCNFIMMQEIKDPGFYKPYPSESERKPKMTFLNSILRNARYKIQLKDYYDKNSGSFKSEGRLEKEFDEVLALKYVVIIEQSKYIKPQITTYKTFKAGLLTLRAHVLDLADNKILATVSFSATNDSKVVAASSRKSQKKILDDIWSNARKSMNNALKNKVNFKFTPYR